MFSRFKAIYFCLKLDLTFMLLLAIHNLSYKNMFLWFIFFASQIIASLNFGASLCLSPKRWWMRMDCS